ncbi:hypothetical protein BaRGS_00015754, partial [Batillaria attramentaria]
VLAPPLPVCGAAQRARKGGTSGAATHLSRPRYVINHTYLAIHMFPPYQIDQGMRAVARSVLQDRDPSNAAAVVKFRSGLQRTGFRVELNSYNT